MPNRDVSNSDRVIDTVQSDITPTPAERLVVGIEYQNANDLIVLSLSDGTVHSIPRKIIQGLGSIPESEVSNVKILGRGAYLHWPKLDLDLYVPELLKGITGTKLWMQELGRRGGSVTSLRKLHASRINGRRGGRPRGGSRAYKSSISIKKLGARSMGNVALKNPPNSAWRFAFTKEQFAYAHHLPANAPSPSVPRIA